MLRTTRLVCLLGAIAAAPSALAAKAEIMLPIGDVFDQDSTMYCWAYSSYHTLRTYYTLAANGGTDGAAQAWHDATQPLNGDGAFRDWLEDRFNPNQGNNPARFVVTFKTDNHLPDQAWTDFYPSDVMSVREVRELAFDGPRPPAGFPTQHMTRTKILEKVRENLKKDIPSVFCNPEHCMTIYGVVMDSNGTATEYAIADSIGARTYRRAASRVYNDLDLVMTLP